MKDNNSGFSSNRRDFSPFTKDLRGEEHYNESIDLFFTPSKEGNNRRRKPLPIFSHCLSLVVHRSSSSMSTGCVVPLREERTVFCPAESGWAGRVYNNMSIDHKVI